MLTIIHGDDTAKSREYYFEERAKYPEKIILDGSSLALTEFIQAVSGNGLFGDQKTVFIENLFSKRKPSKELDSLISQIAQATQTLIFLWESRVITKKQLQQFSNVEIKQFSIPKTIFSFLDSLAPKNSKKSIALFQELLKTEDANFALFMLQRQIRILLAIHSQYTVNSNFTNNQGISEVSRLAPWQIGKLQKQANAFSQERLLNLHEQLYKLELAQKTGKLAYPLDQAIDFFLLSV